MFKKISIIIILLTVGQSLYAAVGCTLNNPDRDIRRLFPEATNYKTEFISIEDNGGEELLKECQLKLKDKFEPRYEAIDVPYAYYTVLNKTETIGYVHGVNQKGMYGGIQLILASDPNGVIIDFYYQKITSPEAKKFKDRAFTKQFVGLSLKDFYDIGLADKIKAPVEDNTEDFTFTLRGIKKNLILLDEFKLNNKYDRYFYKQKGDDHEDNENSQ